MASYCLAERYDVQYCYVENGKYTSWEHASCLAVGGKGQDGKIYFNFYWPTEKKVCFSLKIEEMDLYSMSKKEVRQREKAKLPFKGKGYVQYYTFSGRYNLARFPGGDAFLWGDSPKGQWVKSTASFKYRRDTGVFTVFFEGYQLSIALMQNVYYSK